MLEARINPDYQETSCKFEYGTEPSLATHTTVACPAPLGAGGGAVGTSVVLSGLTPASAYYYRVLATNGTGTATDTIETFTTLPLERPVIESESASGVTLAGATLEAQINPQYQTTTYSFEYSPEESVLLESNGTKTPDATLPAGSILSGFSEHQASAHITGLQPNRTYYYRVAAHNATGPVLSMLTVAHFTTANTPEASTGEAQDITATTATLSGTVNPGALPTSYYFQYGGTTAYGQQTLPTPAGAGASPAPAATEIAALEPGSTYHYRLVATNTSNGTTQTAYGDDKTFTTPSTPPILTGLAASNITQNTATITATLNPQNLSTRYELDIGATPGALQPQAAGNTTSTTQITLNTGPLTPGTLYYYKLTATNTNGTTAPEGTFTTSPATEPPGPITQPPTPPLLTTPPITIPNETPNTTTTRKPLTNTQKLTKALKTCKKDKQKTKRTKCEKQAHKKYPTKHKKHS